MSAHLWHFTCSHSATQIGKRGLIHPHPHPLLDWEPIAWFTSDPMPERDHVGLTSSMLSCDRMEHRYRVTDSNECIPWERWADEHAVDPAARRDLESLSLPSSWWVATVPVPVVAA